MFGLEIVSTDFRAKKIKFLTYIAKTVHGPVDFRIYLFYPGYCESNLLAKYFYTNAILCHL